MTDAAYAMVGVITSALVVGGFGVITAVLNRAPRAETPATPASTPMPTDQAPEPSPDADDTEIVTWLYGEVRRLLRDQDVLRSEVGRLRGLIVTLVHPLVQWIDAGATPPPPEVPAELRKLIAEAEAPRPA